MRGAGPVIAVSALCTGLGAALGFTPGFTATALRDDLGISRGQVGLLISLYFGCTGLASVTAARFTDRLGARRVVVLDMAAVSASGVISALAGTYWSLLVAAVLGGCGYSLVNSGTNVAIARSVSVGHRTLAMSVKTAGVPGMAVVAAALGPWAAGRWGWQQISWLIGILGAAVAVAAWLVLDDERPIPAAASGERAGRAALPAGFVWFPVGAFLLIAASQPLYSWVVAYLEESLETSGSTAGAVSAVASAVGVAVMIVNSLRADRIGPDRRIPLVMVMLVVSAAATTMIALAEAAGLWLAVVGTVIGIAAQLSAIGTMHAAIVDRAPHAVARATGWTMTGYYLGALLSPFAFGLLVDRTGTYTYSWASMVVLMVLAVGTWHRARGNTSATGTRGETITMGTVR